MLPRRPYGIVGFKVLSSDKLFNLQSAELTPGVIGQTPRQRQPQKGIFGYSGVCSSNVLTPPPYQRVTPAERRGENDKAIFSLAGQL